MHPSTTFLFGLDRRDVSIAVLVHAALAALVVWGSLTAQVGGIRSTEISAVLLSAPIPKQKPTPQKLITPTVQPQVVKSVSRPEAPLTVKESPAEVQAPIAAQAEKIVAISQSTPAQTISSQDPVRNQKEAHSFVDPKFDAAYLNNPKPSYPQISRRLNEEGRVMLRVFVDSSGKPQEIKVLQSSGFQRLDQAALETVKQWRFIAAQRAGQAVASWVQVPISFQLRR